MTEKNSNGKTDPGTVESRVLEVRDWPDLGLRKWRDWGFAAEEVYRIARYNFLVQPVRSTLAEQTGPDSAFVLEGRLYSLDESSERRLAKLSNIFYIVLLIFFLGILWLVKTGSGISAAVLFVLMYILIEGFLPLSMRLIAPDRMVEKVEIPWSLLNRVILLTRLDVLLLGWDEGKAKHAVAVRFHAGVAKKVYERLSKALKGTIPILEADSSSLGKPPDRMK